MPVGRVFCSFAEGKSLTVCWNLVRSSPNLASTSGVPLWKISSTSFHIIVPYTHSALPVPSISGEFLHFFANKVTLSALELGAIVAKLGLNLKSTLVQDYVDFIPHHCAIHTLSTVSSKHIGRVFALFC